MKVKYEKRFEIKVGDRFEFMLLNCGDTSTVEILEVDLRTIKYRVLGKELSRPVTNFLLEFSDEIPGDATVELKA